MLIPTSENFLCWTTVGVGLYSSGCFVFRNVFSLKYFQQYGDGGQIRLSNVQRSVSEEWSVQRGTVGIQRWTWPFISRVRKLTVILCLCMTTPGLSKLSLLSCYFDKIISLIGYNFASTATARIIIVCRSPEPESRSYPIMCGWCWLKHQRIMFFRLKDEFRQKCIDTIWLNLVLIMFF